MEELFSKISQLGVNIDTNSLVEIARYWFWKDIIGQLLTGISLLGLFSLIIITAYKVISNFATGEWK